MTRRAIKLLREYLAGFPDFNQVECINMEEYFAVNQLFDFKYV